MEYTDVIARLYPLDSMGRSDALDTITMIHNRPRYVRPPPLESPEPTPPPWADSYRSTGLAEPPEEHGNSIDYEACLELRFSSGPRTGQGFVFGTDPATCDIVLPPLPGTSKHHCALTFEVTFEDARVYRPVLRDLRSLNGTRVTYNGKGGALRHDFRWILGGYKFPDRENVIVIQIVPRLKFQVVVSELDIDTPEYIYKVNHFLQGTADPESLFGQFGFPSGPSTGLYSESRTPGTDPILIRHRELGRGAFGVVSHIWDVSSCMEYAVKEPTEKALREKRVDKQRWIREAGFLKRISHEHIVRIFDARESPSPQLYLEYVPGGSLGDHENISSRERLQILCQCLSALAYLHRLEKPIVHRDIKPDNILVQWREEGDIHIKLTDFGLSRQSADPTTLCGTRPYIAPEIHLMTRARKSYTPAADIWSLGVVIFESACGLEGTYAYAEQWCRRIVKKLHDSRRRNPDNLKNFLSDFMVIMDPEIRGSAERCYRKALRLAAPGSAGSGALTLASYGGGGSRTPPAPPYSDAGPSFQHTSKGHRGHSNPISFRDMAEHGRSDHERTQSRNSFASSSSSRSSATARPHKRQRSGSITYAQESVYFPREPVSREPVSYVGYSDNTAPEEAVSDLRYVENTVPRRALPEVPYLDNTVPLEPMPEARYFDRDRLRVSPYVASSAVNLGDESTASRWTTQMPQSMPAMATRHLERHDRETFEDRLGGYRPGEPRYTGAPSDPLRSSRHFGPRQGESSTERVWDARAESLRQGVARNRRPG